MESAAPFSARFMEQLPHSPNYSGLTADSGILKDVDFTTYIPTRHFNSGQQRTARIPDDSRMILIFPLSPSLLAVGS